MDIMNIIGSLTGNDTVGAISEKFGIESNKVSGVLKSAIPSLVSAMQKNVSTEAGAASLGKALQDHAGDFNLGDMLKNVDLVDGGKILGKIMGGETDNFISGLSSKFGLAGSQITNILSSIAPTLLNLLGNLRKKNNSADADLGSLLGMVLGGGKKTSGLGSILGGLGKIFGGR